jgi:hypothetical protein
MLLWRFNESGIDGQIRNETNNTDLQSSFPTVRNNFFNTDTNTTRFYRITRVGDVFTFYQKTNVFDSWAIVNNADPAAGYVQAAGTITRADWNGQRVQVGIAEGMFSATAVTTFFTDFELFGPSVSFGGTAPDSPTNVVTSIVNSNSVSVSWDPAGNASGSLVLVRANGTLNRGKPAPGITYTSNNDFKSTNSSLFNGNARIVYVGSGTNVTVTGLGGSNNLYQVAVYSYSGAGPTYSVFPATNSFSGPGIPLSLSLTVNSTNLPAGGVTPATALVTFTSGDTINVSTDPSTIWSSTDPNVIVGGNGTATAISNGVASVIANFFGAIGTNGPGPITVHTPAFIDTFTVAHDYATNGIAGSPWDGLYARAGDVPYQTAGNLGNAASSMLQMDANMTQPTGLYLRYSQTGWEVNESDGDLLWKSAVGDFQALCHIRTYDILPFNFVGLMARLAQTNGPTNATFPLGTTNGGPFGTPNGTFPNGREDGVRWMRFDEFAISTSSRQNVNGGNTSRDNNDGETTSYWLLMVRSNTTFFFYKKANYTDPWLPVPASTAAIAAAAGQPMQVGLSALCFANNNRSATFDYFALDATNIVPYTPPPAAGAPGLTAFTNSTITLTWTNGPGAAGSIVVVRANGPVNVQPQNGVVYTASPTFGQGSALGSGCFVVYDGTGTTVTISNVIPGVFYYATVYSYSGAGPSIVYNTTEASNGNAVKALGTIRNLLLLTPGGTNVLYGGVGFYNAKVVFDSGVTNDVTTEVSVYITPPEAAGGATNGVYTPLTNTPFQINAIYTVLGLSATNTNTVVITTRSPVYTDEFNQNHDYLNNGEAGSIFDGAYFGGPTLHPSNSIPGGNLGVGGEGQTIFADANITSNGVLTVQSLGGDWEFAGDDGFLLLKNINGPSFQTSVHIIQADDVFPPDANANVGLIARAASGVNGGPFNGDGEDWVSWSRFDLFGIQNDGRSTINGATTRLEVRDGSTNYWLLLARQDTTNFYFLERLDTNSPWLLRQNFNTVRTDLPSSMQVGIQTAMFAANTGTAMFEHFMLDGTATRPTLSFSRAGNTLTISWSTAYSAYELQSTSSLSPIPAWSYVVTSKTITNGTISVSIPVTSPPKFYRLGR